MSKDIELENAPSNISTEVRSVAEATVESAVEALNAICGRLGKARSKEDVGNVVRDLSAFSTAIVGLALGIAEAEVSAGVRAGMTRAEAEYAACKCGECKSRLDAERAGGSNAEAN